MDISLLFNFHVTSRYNSFSFFEIGRKQPYLDKKATEKKFIKNFESKQQPLLDSIIKVSGRKDYAFSLLLSGQFIEQLSNHYPKYVESITKQIQKGKIELLGSTYHKSVSSLFSAELYKLEIEKHKKLIKKTFDYSPKTLNNSENIYSNSLGKLITKNGYEQAVVPAIEWYLPEDDHSRILYSKGDENLSLILTDFKSSNFFLGSLESDTLLLDSSLRNEFIALQADPLVLSKEVDWLRKIEKLKKRKNRLITVSEAVNQHAGNIIYNIPSTLALSPEGYDLSYYTENPLQKEFLEKLKTLKSQINIKKDVEVFEDLSQLSSTENLLSISTKANEADITEPYDAYLQFMNMLSDLEIRMFRKKL